jgi:hypothetical protein
MKMKLKKKISPQERERLIAQLQRARQMRRPAPQQRVQIRKNLIVNGGSGIAPIPQEKDYLEDCPFFT